MKIGDIVIFTSPSGYSTGKLTVGNIYQVQAVNISSVNTKIMVRGVDYWFESNHFKLQKRKSHHFRLEPTTQEGEIIMPKFKVGDKVKLVRHNDLTT